MTKLTKKQIEIEREIKKEVDKAIDKGFELGMKKQIIDDLEWIEDNFVGVRIFVETKEAIIERRAELKGILKLCK